MKKQYMDEEEKKKGIIITGEDKQLINIIHFIFIYYIIRYLLLQIAQTKPRTDYSEKKYSI